MRGFESHSLRVFVTTCTTPGGIPKLAKGTVCYTVRAARPPRGFESHSLRCRTRRRQSQEAIRMVEEPGLNPGRPSGLRAFEPPRFRAFTLST